MQKRLELELLDETVAVLRLEPQADIPEWVYSSGFLSITRTGRELSIVCDQSKLPGAAVPSDVEARLGLRCLAVRGPLSFTEIGILQAIAQPLADASISIFVISTFDTDYLMVADLELDRAIAVLSEAGHRVFDVRGGSEKVAQ